MWIDEHRVATLTSAGRGVEWDVILLWPGHWAGPSLPSVRSRVQHRTRLQAEARPVGVSGVSATDTGVATGDATRTCCLPAKSRLHAPMFRGVSGVLVARRG